MCVTVCCADVCPESIVEAALCKSVLKPVREPVYSGLKELHTRTGSLKRLKENQALILGTTSTDLGVTTSVPETPAMEKISAKLWNLHQEYSPQRKIDLLLKTCKIIYDSMSVGCPGLSACLSVFYVYLSTWLWAGCVLPLFCL